MNKKINCLVFGTSYNSIYFKSYYSNNYIKNPWASVPLTAGLINTDVCFQFL